MHTKLEYSSTDWGPHFQTPRPVCEYMAGFMFPELGVLRGARRLRILEPTPGQGNLVKVLERYGDVTAPRNFDKMKDQHFDWVVMNPPFTPAQRGYDMLFRCMGMSHRVIALMPWVTLVNSEPRTKKLVDYGLRSVTHLPRRIFSGARVQTCILELASGYEGETELKFYNDGNTKG